MVEAVEVKKLKPVAEMHKDEFFGGLRADMDMSREERGQAEHHIRLADSALRSGDIQARDRELVVIKRHYARILDIETHALELRAVIEKSDLHDSYKRSANEYAKQVSADRTQILAEINRLKAGQATPR
ncbi:MAG: hypothetical protein RLZZ283_205 [Candidatus Parcubacteria bacterium]|jgi:hypothetical protein